MSRDTQFQNFAHALWEELCNDCFGEWWDTDNPHAGDDAQQAIARRAYDLVKHAFSEVDSVTIQFEEVPDMTELPKEQEEDPDWAKKAAKEIYDKLNLEFADKGVRLYDPNLEQEHG